MSLIEDCAGPAGAAPQTWGTCLINNIVFVGLDVHKATIVVAVAEGARGGEVCFFMEKEPGYRADLHPIWSLTHIS